MSESSDAEISVHVNNVDYVVTSAGPMDDPGELERVPVLRIYGMSATSAKACVHVHQVYPYFYIEYAGPLDPDSGVFATLLFHRAVSRN
jgi:DNA polymerase zeta